jgi:hypothetical protein
MTVPLAMVRRLLDRFWNTLDGEGVSLFQWVVYLSFIFSGIYNLLIAIDPPLTLEAMGWMNYQLWCWFLVLGPCYSLLGKILKRTRFAYHGMWLQAIGDAATNVSLLAYVTATFQTEYWGRGAFGGILGVAIWLCTGFLILRDVRRLRAVERTL